MHGVGGVISFLCFSLRFRVGFRAACIVHTSGFLQISSVVQTANASIDYRLKVFISCVNH
jgi:hypothetical protein